MYWFFKFFISYVFSSLIDFQEEQSDVSMGSVDETTYTIVENGSQKGKEKLIDSSGYSFCIRVSIKRICNPVSF